METHSLKDSHASQHVRFPHLHSATISSLTPVGILGNLPNQKGDSPRAAQGLEGEGSVDWLTSRRAPWYSFPET